MKTTTARYLHISHEVDVSLDVLTLKKRVRVAWNKPGKTFRRHPEGGPPKPKNKKALRRIIKTIRREEREAKQQKEPT